MLPSGDLTTLCPQAIKNTTNEADQDTAWRAVCPLVSRLNNYYQYSLELENQVQKLSDYRVADYLRRFQHSKIFLLFSSACRPQIIGQLLYNIKEYWVAIGCYISLA